MSLAVDPITVSVIQHRLRAIVEEMGEAMLRTSYSQILNSSRDFSTALCDPEGRLIAQAEHVPIHVGALPYAAKAVHDFFVGTIRPGDVYLLNDPYCGGNHLPDLTAFVPVFDGEHLAFWSINRSHQSDIGGATHGAYNASATEIFQEGLRVPPLKLYDAGTRREDVYEMIVLNVRHPRDFRGDLAAMIGSARIGERRLAQLLAEFGSATTHAGVEAVLDGAERQVRTIISGWKDGTYEGEAFLDDDGHTSKDIHIRARITKRGSDLEVDLTDSHPQVVGFINSSFANTHSAVVVALAYLIDPDIPKNDGAFRPLKVKLKEGTVVWPTRRSPCAPITVARRSSRPLSARWRPPVPIVPWPDGGGASALPFKVSIPARRGPSSGICSRPVPVAGPLPPATVGLLRVSGRQQAVSSSAVSRCTRCAFPYFSAVTSSAPIVVAMAAIAAGRERNSR